jgi:hypothetical protein
MRNMIKTPAPQHSIMPGNCILRDLDLEAVLVYRQGNAENQSTAGPPVLVRISANATIHPTAMIC